MQVSPVKQRLLVASAVVLGCIALLLLLRSGDDGGLTRAPNPEITVPRISEDAPSVADPFAWSKKTEPDLLARAARGTAHPLYVRSPGGVKATAARVARYREPIVGAATKAGVDPDLLEGMVFLESAGIPDAIAGGRDTEGAVGLTQILAETGQNLLGLRVEHRESERLTRRIARARDRGQTGRVERLKAERRTVDERFDPGKAIEAAGRYLGMARARFGREDMAVVSYHMGMGNLTDVLEDFGGKAVSYAQLYFDSSPTRHAKAFARLSSFGDESSLYYFKVLAARDIMAMFREDPEELDRQISLQTAKNSAEEVLHPSGSTEQFGDPKVLKEAWDDELIVAIPDEPARLGLRRDPRIGELARLIEQKPSLYQGLRREALALLLYMSATVREISGDEALTITSGVRDERYQNALQRRNIQATRNFSLHTTGWAFDISRRYESRKQARAFQFVLDRLTALDLIAWVREPAAIHVTASEDAEAYLPLLEGVE